MRRLVSAPWGPAKRPSRGAPRIAGLLLIAGALGVAGCGPSFEAIQEGDLRFAHCDRLDLDPNISPSHRLHCWREWRRVYTYGQTRDRVEYAQRRIAEVVSGDTGPAFDLPTGSGRPSSTNQPSAPNPVHSPPPAVVPVNGNGSGIGNGASGGNGSGATSGSSSESALARDAPAGTFGMSCRSRCEQARAGCTPGCETQPRGCQECESTLESCLSSCKAQP